MHIGSSTRSALFAAVLLALAAAAYGQINISVSFAPPQILIFAQSPIVRRQYNRTIGLSRIGMSLSGREQLRRTSVLSPNTLLVLRKRGLHRNNRHSLLQ